MEISVEPLVLQQRPRIIAQLGVIFALAAAGLYGFLTFKPPEFAKERNEEEPSLVFIISGVLCLVSIIPAIYLFQTL